MAEVPEIAGYVVEELLGEGAHGAVYRAHPTTDPNDVIALKVVEHTGNIDRLLLEPDLLSRFKHPNIVRLRDYSIHAGKLVLVMEYVRGPSLEALLQSHPIFSSTEVREFLRQMADALAHAHAVGVFHSDLKPSNVIVEATPQGPRYVIIDFGVSRMTDTIQMRKRVTGTYSYMAPEQLRGRGGKAADLWALGSMAYRMLTGSRPFEGSTMDELTKQILYHNPTFPPQEEERDDELERTIVHLLEKNPAERTESASTLLAELTGSDVEDRPVLNAEGDRISSRWENRVHREIRRRWVWIALLVGLAFLPDGVYWGVFPLGGAMLVTRGSERRRRSYIAAGLLLFVVGVFVPNLAEMAPTDEAQAALSVASLYFGIFLLPAGIQLVKIRRLQRELLLFGLIRQGRAEDSLAVLRAYVEVNVGDIHAHERYIEGLLAAGHAEDAAVEALTLLRVDPYNFDASLLLAHAYLELGLFERCQQVCNGYLEVSGHCFEFQDILERASFRERSAA